MQVRRTELPAPAGDLHTGGLHDGGRERAAEVHRARPFPLAGFAPAAVSTPGHASDHIHISATITCTSGDRDVDACSLSFHQRIAKGRTLCEMSTLPVSRQP